MNYIKLLFWVVVALWWVNIIVVAKVGNTIRNYKGFGSRSGERLFNAQLIPDAFRRDRHCVPVERTTSKDIISNYIIIRAP